MATVLCLCTGFAMARSVTVSAGTTKTVKTSGVVVVAVISEGTPQEEVTVEFCRTEEAQDCAAVTTDEQGTARSFQLPGGNYFIVATTKHGLVADHLKFRASHSLKPTFLKLDMTMVFQAARDQIAVADKLPIRERAQQFQGCVRDRLGAPIARVNIRVLRNGEQGGENGMSLKSDAHGDFSAQLSDGAYVAVFRKAGFGMEIVPFQINPQGGKEIMVQLKNIAELVPY